MALTLREDNFVVIDVGSTVTKAGMGMNDTNKPPSVMVNMAEFNNPIKNQQIVSWANLEESWHHVLFKELGIKKSRNESAVLLTVPVQWTKLEHERIAQIFFENLNVPGIYIAPQPLLSLYGCGSMSGIVIDIGAQATDVNIVTDSIVQPSCSFTIPIAGDFFDQYLLKLLKEDTVLVEQFQQINDDSVTLDIEFARFVKEQRNVCNVFVGHELPKDPLSGEPTDVVDALAAATEEVTDGETTEQTNDEEEKTEDIPSTIEVEYKSHKFTIGPYRHKVYDPLFSSELAGTDGLTLTEAILLATTNCEPPEIRPKLWENVVIAGGCGLMAGLKARIKSEMTKVLPCSENAGDSQPRQISFLRIPDYFTALKEKEHQIFSTWLGGEIVAKLVFIDAKNYVSKVDYSERGPSVVHTKSY